MFKMVGMKETAEEYLHIREQQEYFKYRRKWDGNI